MSNRRDGVKPGKAEHGRAPNPCAFGCQQFRPLACEVIDPFTVRMDVACVRCGRTQSRVGDLRHLIDDADKSAESFAAAFMHSPIVGGERA